MKYRKDKEAFAKKSLGQNFLADGAYVEKIISAVDPQGDETIVEIGAGRGALTERLVELAREVIAVELDRDLIPELARRFGQTNGFRLVEENALKIDFASYRPQDGSRLKLVANLPYYISTAILQRLIEQRNEFSSMVLMFQREVVDRITAGPGTSERGYLTVLVEAFLHVERLFDVPPTAFRPVPKVWSAVVRIIPKESETAVPANFREIVSSGFRQKRKTLANNLKLEFPAIADELDKCGINAKSRAEDLTLDDWLALAGAIGR